MASAHVPSAIKSLRTELYILQNGIVVFGGKMVGKGGVWGEDMLICYQSLRTRAFAKAHSYVEAFSIDRETLLGVSQHFSDSHRRIRGYIGWLAFRRMLVVIATREMAMRRQLGRLNERSPYLQAVFAVVYAENPANAADPFAQFAATGSEAYKVEEICQDNSGSEDSVRITVVSASGLPAADSNGLSDPYAVLTLSTHPRKNLRTKTIKKTLSPSWDERFEWTGHRDELRGASCEVKVYDWDRLSRDDLLGTGVVKLSFLSDVVTEHTIALSPQGSVTLRVEGIWAVQAASKIKDSCASRHASTISSCATIATTAAPMDADEIAPRPDFSPSKPLRETTGTESREDGRTPSPLRRHRSSKSIATSKTSIQQLREELAVQLKDQSELHKRQAARLDEKAASLESAAQAMSTCNPTR